MRIDHLSQTVSFEYGDMHFVKKHGVVNATEMVLAYADTHDLPFLSDTYQLAAFLGLSHRDLHRLLRNIDRAYRSITLKKRTGGVRHIHAPQTMLSQVQRIILRNILDRLPLSPYATAYRKRRNLLSNAAPHCKKRYLLKLDLENFFGNIRFDQVYSCVFNTYRFPRQIGAILTTLCCYRDVLPQGAPTSPALSNLVMKHFDDTMGNWCQKQGFAYTRYCDDITISGDKPLYTAFTKARCMLENMGFALNGRKTHFITHANRQTVTGLVVNERPGVPREYRRALRQEIYYAAKYGVEDALLHREHSAFLTDGKLLALKYLDHLEGKVRYVMQYHQEDCQWKQALLMLHRLRDKEADDTEYTPYYTNSNS